MKKTLRKIDSQEKNTILEMHRNKGYRTIIEEDDTMSDLLNDPTEFYDEEIMSTVDSDEMTLTNDEDIKNFGFDTIDDDMADGSIELEEYMTDEDELGISDPDISDEEFFDIYTQSNEMSEGETETKPKTKPTVKPGKPSTPFSPKPGPNPKPKAEKGKIKETYRLTESELISLIKRAIYETK